MREKKIPKFEMKKKPRSALSPSLPVPISTTPMPNVSKKGNKAAQRKKAAVAVAVASPRTRLANATKVALPRESSPDEVDQAPTSSTESESESEAQMNVDDDEEAEEEDDDEESEDVTPEAMERMMKLLGQVDAAELGLMIDEDDEEEEDDDEEEEEEGILEGESDSEEEEEALYEELQESDTDVVPIEKNTTNDKVGINLLPLSLFLAKPDPDKLPLSLSLVQAALERVLSSIKLETDFFDTLTLVNPTPLNVPDASNDLERELELSVFFLSFFFPSSSLLPRLCVSPSFEDRITEDTERRRREGGRNKRDISQNFRFFTHERRIFRKKKKNSYKQSLWAATRAEQLFEKANLPFHRPDDYFAEMVKTDQHMSKIRQSLLDEQAGMKASDEARKLRELKKFGKKVQVEKLREREKEKKAVGERLESLKKSERLLLFSSL